MSIAYLDTSAIIKLIRIELNSENLRTWLGGPRSSDLAWASSALVLIEVPRALRRILPGSTLPDCSSILGRFTLRNVDEEILVQAGAYAEPTLRSLDAIHLATAMVLAPAGISRAVAGLRSAMATMAIAEASFRWDSNSATRRLMAPQPMRARRNGFRRCIIHGPSAVCNARSSKAPPLSPSSMLKW